MPLFWKNRHPLRLESVHSHEFHDYEPEIKAPSKEFKPHTSHEIQDSSILWEVPTVLWDYYGIVPIDWLPKYQTIIRDAYVITKARLFRKLANERQRCFSSMIMSTHEQTDHGGFCEAEPGSRHSNVPHTALILSPSIADGLATLMSIYGVFTFCRQRSQRRPNPPPPEFLFIFYFHFFKFIYYGDNLREGNFELSKLIGKDTCKQDRNSACVTRSN